MNDHIEIVICQGQINEDGVRLWGYCPRAALSMLKPEYDPEWGPWPTSDEALAFAKQDKSIPKGSTFTIVQGVQE